MSCVPSRLFFSAVTNGYIKMKSQQKPLSYLCCCTLSTIVEVASLCNLILNILCRYMVCIVSVTPPRWYINKCRIFLHHLLFIWDEAFRSSRKGASFPNLACHTNRAKSRHIMAIVQSLTFIFSRTWFVNKSSPLGFDRQ